MRSRILKRRLPEVVAWIVLLPALVLTVVNADLTRLALGAFGPRPDRLLVVWFAVGALIAGAAWWAARGRSAAGRAPFRMGILAGAAVVAAIVCETRARQVDTRNVSFPSGNISVAATVYTPKSPGPHPTVVFVPGSAPFKKGFYALWAEQLAGRGIASVVADKRGVGGTGGNYENNNNSSLANFELLAGDVVAALNFAALLPGVDTTRLGLFGISQAGWVAPIAALRSPRARYMVLITAPPVSVHEENVWSNLRGDDHGPASASLTVAEATMDTVTIGGVDARPRLAALTIPGLWLFGSSDNSIPTRKSMAALETLRQGGQRFDAREFRDAGHALLTKEGRLIPRIAPASWDTIGAWLAREGILR